MLTFRIASDMWEALHPNCPRLDDSALHDGALLLHYNRHLETAWYADESVQKTVVEMFKKMEGQNSDHYKKLKRLVFLNILSEDCRKIAETLKSSLTNREFSVPKIEMIDPKPINDGINLDAVIRCCSNTSHDHVKEVEEELKRKKLTVYLDGERMPDRDERIEIVLRKAPG